MKNLSASVKEKADKMAAAIIEAMKAGSVQYAASCNGEIVVSNSVGKYDKAESRPLRSDDMYGIGSTSKTYVAVSTMMLADKGLIDIEKPYKDYVPEFEMLDPRYLKITPKHLMNHSSGIYGTHMKGGFLFEDANTYAHDNLLRLLKNCTLKYDPGTFSEYCNDGFQLLELLVERVSGLSYSEFLQKNIFEPLGIKNTKTPLDSFDRGQLPRFCMEQVYGEDLPYESTNLIGTGGLVSSAEDLCRFGQGLLSGKLIPKELLKRMGEKEYLKSAFWPKDDEAQNMFAYGLGFDHVHVHPFDKVGYQAVFKGGDTLQYHASLLIIPELELVAASVSAGAASFANLLLTIELLKDACLEYGFVKEFPAAGEPAAPVKQDMPEELKKYVGLYAENGKFMNLEIKDGEIDMPAMMSGMLPAQKYVYAGGDRFVGPDGKNKLHFVEVGGGRTYIQGDLEINIPNVGVVPMKAFLYQKLDKNPISADVAAAWEKRNGKKYFLADDIYTSAFFLMLSPPHGGMEMTVNTEYGFAYGGAKIIGENKAVNTLFARDVADIEFCVEDGVEYLFAKNLRYMDADAIACLSAETGTVTIPADDRTLFYKVSDCTAGKTLTVKTPATGVFGAYGAQEEGKEAAPAPLKALTTIMGNKPVKLAKGDTLAFNGSKGDVFTLELAD